MTYQFTAVENIDSQSNWKEMNVIKSLDHRFQTPKMKFLKYLWTVDYNRAFFTKKTDRRLKYGRKNRSIRSRTNATVSLPLEIEALMVLQHMLSWKLLCTAPPRSTVALSRFPDRRLADIVLYRCAHMKGRQQCRPEKNRILKKKKKNDSNQRAPKIHLLNRSIFGWAWHANDGLWQALQPCEVPLPYYVPSSWLLFNKWLERVGRANGYVATRRWHILNRRVQRPRLSRPIAAIKTHTSILYALLFNLI